VLVPTLRVGTPWCDAPRRVSPGGVALTLTGRGASRPAFPRGAWERERGSLMTTTTLAPVAERALEVLRRAGNPFRNYFARNPDDEVCALYHVPELFARERGQLLALLDLYRYTPTTPPGVVPVLGSKGAGKTHLLHSIKHGAEGPWQLLVTPGTYQK